MSGLNQFLSLLGTCLVVGVCTFCQSPPPEGLIPQSEGLSLMDNSIRFFEEHALDSTTGAFYSDLDVSGQITSPYIHLVALSRLTYALAYSSEFFPERLAKAERAGRFILEKMVLRDSLGPYFVESFHVDSGPEIPKVLGLWQQSYGLGGLAELYRQTQDQGLLDSLHALFPAYIKRFRDAERGGFCQSSLPNQGPILTDKSLQSLLYPVSAALAGLWEADTANRAQYEPIMAEHLQKLAHNCWDEQKGWVKVAFDQDWQPKSVEEVSPGHNFQLAWVLMKGAAWPFVSQQEGAAYRHLGKQIIRRTMNQPVWDGGPKQGFFEAWHPGKDSLTSDLKSWWQTCEALIALSFVKEEQADNLQALYGFFSQHFPDRARGNEYFHLTAENLPVETELKGSMGKSSYHVTEMVRYLIQHGVMQPSQVAIF
ncbi:MAG: AGE family epimerase/isomerase [Bacteroidota bacterium]